MGFADGPNLYAYVHNRPLISIDPDGQFGFLIPIVISLALDYCAPIAAAYLAEYAAGGVVAASLLSGFVSGYNDPVSSALDPATYSLADGDVTTFLCNCAGMLAGAAFACKPSSLAKNGAQSVANAAGKEIIGTAISKAETAVIKNVMTTGARLGNKGSVQKTVQIAERNLESSFKSSQWKFPKNPNELLKELPRNAKGEIHVCDNLRIRPEKHAFQAGDRYNPRHHEQHYHVEFRRNETVHFFV